MIRNPFVLYEFDFDAELFRRHYGSINHPGIYAIPEDEVEPSGDDESEEDKSSQQQVSIADPADPEESKTEQNLTDKDKIVNFLSQTPGIQMPQLNQDEQNAYDAEISPIKKIYLINKLNQLSYLLKSKFSSNTDLDLILKFASSLSYRTLQILTINVINHLRELAQSEEQKEGSGTNNEQM